MRTFMIEVLGRDDEMPCITLSKSPEFFLQCRAWGMSAAQLLRRGTVEWLSPDGCQCRATFLDTNTHLGPETKESH